MVNVLRHQPLDLVEFAAQYFSDLLENRDQTKELPTGEMVITVNEGGSNPQHSDDDEQMDDAEGKVLNYIKYFSSSTRGTTTASE